MKLAHKPLSLLLFVHLIFFCFSETQAQKFQFESRLDANISFNAAHAFQNKFFVGIEIDEEDNSKEPIYKVLLADSNLIEVKSFSITLSEFKYDKKDTKFLFIESSEHPHVSSIGTFILINKTKQFAAIQYDFNKLSYKVTEGELPGKREYTNYISTAEKAFIVGIDKNKGFYVLPLNFDGTASTPNFQSSIDASRNLSNFRIDDSQYLPQEGLFYISLTNYNTKKNVGETKILTLNKQGVVVDEIDFEPIKNHLFYGLSYHQEEDGSIIIGGSMLGDNLTSLKYNHGFGHILGESVFILKWNKNKEQEYFQTIAIDDLDTIRRNEIMGRHQGKPTYKWAEKNYSKVKKKRQKALAKGKVPKNKPTFFVTRNISVDDHYVYLTGDFYKASSFEVAPDPLNHGQFSIKQGRVKLTPYFIGTIVFDRKTGEYYFNTAFFDIYDRRIYVDRKSYIYTPPSSHPEVILESDSTFTITTNGYGHLEYALFDIQKTKKTGQTIVAISLNEEGNNKNEQIEQGTSGITMRWYDDYFIWININGSICVKNKFIPRQPSDSKIPNISRY